MSSQWPWRGVLVNVLLTFGGTQKLSCFRAVSGIASGGGGGGLLFQRWHTQKHRDRSYCFSLVWYLFIMIKQMAFRSLSVPLCLKR